MSALKSLQSNRALIESFDDALKAYRQFELISFASSLLHLAKQNGSELWDA